MSSALRAGLGRLWMAAALLLLAATADARLGDRQKGAAAGREPAPVTLARGRSVSIAIAWC